MRAQPETASEPDRGRRHSHTSLDEASSDPRRPGLIPSGSASRRPAGRERPRRRAPRHQQQGVTKSQPAQVAARRYRDIRRIRPDDRRLGNFRKFETVCDLRLCTAALSTGAARRLDGLDRPVGITCPEVGPRQRQISPPRGQRNRQSGNNRCRAKEVSHIVLGAAAQRKPNGQDREQNRPTESTSRQGTTATEWPIGL